MSRTKRFTRSLFSGYALLGVNIFYTLASVPLALHYLSKEEFALWLLVMQVAGYLQLIDLGMSGSISRILIDHKDNQADGVYGSVIKTGFLVLLVQGLIVMAVGALFSFWLPSLFNVPTAHHRDLQILGAGQCVIMGILFVGRMPRYLLEAHQRYDMGCFSQMGALLINFGAMWASFALGWGLYSLLVGYALSSLFGVVSVWGIAEWLKLFPQKEARGRINRKTFRELFSYGQEMFLLSVGLQLVSASQIMVISRTLGLEAAAIWSVATKPFILAQQVVARLWDFSSSALAEIIVREEKERLLSRVRDVVILSSSLSVGIGLIVGLCNRDFLLFWTHGRIAWSHAADWLMALWVVIYSSSRCGIGFICISKQIGIAKYVYFLEGVSFVGLSFLVAPIWGLNGIIISALLTNVLFSGILGVSRIKKYFGIDTAFVLNWFRWPLAYLSLLALVLGIGEQFGNDWNPIYRLIINATLASIVSLFLFGKFGLTPALRTEVMTAVDKITRGRLRLLRHRQNEPEMKA